jgi:hypothetical protein
MGELAGYRVQEAADHRRGAAAHHRLVQFCGRFSGRRPVCPPQRENHDLVSGGNQRQVGKQGREQLPVSGDGIPSKRDMRAVIGFCQVFQADVGQPGQAGRRAGELYQSDNALAVGHFGGPLQHPGPSQHPQPRPCGPKAAIEWNAKSDDGALHAPSAPAGHRTLQRSQVPAGTGRRSPASLQLGSVAGKPRAARVRGRRAGAGSCPGRYRHDHQASLGIPASGTAMPAPSVISARLDRAMAPSNHGMSVPGATPLVVLTCIDRHRAGKPDRAALARGRAVPAGGSSRRDNTGYAA